MLKEYVRGPPRGHRSAAQREDIWLRRRAGSPVRTAGSPRTGARRGPGTPDRTFRDAPSKEPHPFPIRDLPLTRSLGVDTLELAPQILPRPSAPAAPSRRLTGLLVAGAAILSMASGLIHVRALPGDSGELRNAGLVLHGRGGVQGGWGA